MIQRTRSQATLGTLLRWRVLLLAFCLYGAVACADPPTSTTVYFVPEGYPERAAIHVVRDGYDQYFCRQNLEGLDLARGRLGFELCTGVILDSEAVAGGVQSVVLIDDRVELSERAREWLSGALIRRDNSHYVIPFGLELREARNTQAGLVAGSRAVVVGERLYQDFYRGSPSALGEWQTTIDATIRSISVPRSPLQASELDPSSDTDEAFEYAVQLYKTGQFEDAYWLFSDLRRSSAQDDSLLGALIALATAAQGGDAYLSGDYGSAFDAWYRFAAQSMWLTDSGVQELDADLRRTYTHVRDRARIWGAAALLQAGEEGQAAQLYPADIVERARANDTRADILRVLSTLTALRGTTEDSAADDGTPAEIAGRHMAEGQEFYLLDRYKDAAAEFEAAYAASPSPDYLYNAAVSYERLRDYSQAADYFERYLSEDADAPDAVEVRRRIGILRTRASQGGATSVDATGGSSPEEAARAHFEAGQSLYMQDQYEAAIEAFRAAYAAFPAPDYLYNIAVSYERLHQYSLAADYFERYLREKADAPDAAEVRRRIHLLRERAMRGFSTGGEPAAGSSPEEAARSHFEAGQSLYSQNRYEAAVEAFRAAYAALPSSYYLYNIAVCYEHLRQYSLAADYFERYLREDADAPDAAEVRRRIDLMRLRALDGGS